MRSVLRQRPHEHPYAHPPFLGAQGLWLVQRVPAPPLGYVTMRSTVGRWVFDAYAHCRDEGGRRPWLRTFDTLSSAVAWMVQHDPEVRALIALSSPEPEAWPPAG